MDGAEVRDGVPGGGRVGGDGDVELDGSHGTTIGPPPRGESSAAARASGRTRRRGQPSSSTTARLPHPASRSFWTASAADRRKRTGGRAATRGGSPPGWGECGASQALLARTRTGAAPAEAGLRCAAVNISGTAAIVGAAETDYVRGSPTSVPELVPPGVGRHRHHRRRPRPRRDRRDHPRRPATSPPRSRREPRHP